MKKNKPKKNKPKKKNPLDGLTMAGLAHLIQDGIRQEIDRLRAISRQDEEIILEQGPPHHPMLRNDLQLISDRPVFRGPQLKKPRTPVRDYFRLIAIVLVVAVGAHFALKKMNGPPKGALYQISSGPGRTWTDYAIAKPTLTASGCVVWFDLDNLGNIFCGEFVISDVPGRVVHE